MVKILKNNKNSLKGIKIAITRSKDQSSELRTKIEAFGAKILELPLIKVLPYCEPKELDDVFAEMGSYEWLIFTSRNGVHNFFDFFFKKFKDIRCIGGLRIACIGKSTAEEVEKYHLEVDFIPEESLAENLAEGLMSYQDLDNTKILIITGNLNRDTLAKTLETKGRAIVDTLQVYQTQLEELSDSKDIKEFREQGADVVVFTSSSAVDSFTKQAKSLKLSSKAKKPLICSIGPQTSNTIKSLRLSVDIQAKDHSLDGIVEALLQHFGV